MRTRGIIGGILSSPHKAVGYGQPRSTIKGRAQHVSILGACNDKVLQNKIFDLKCKDATEVRDAIAQHDLQQKADEALASKSVAAVKQVRTRLRPKSRRGKEWIGLPPELAGRCAGCVETNHMARSCPIRKNRMICSHCGIPGHLATVCFAAL